TAQPLVIPQHMSLRTAAHLLAQAHVTGAPVINESGVCVGVISATDIMRYTEGSPSNVSPRTREEGVCADWQMIELELLPTDEVCCVMSRKLHASCPETEVAELARMMVEGHVHRVIVVDGHDRPIGIVSTMEVLAALGSDGELEEC